MNVWMVKLSRGYYRRITKDNIVKHARVRENKDATIFIAEESAENIVSEVGGMVVEIMDDEKLCI